MLSPALQERYSRQLLLAEVGEAGQEKLARARVLIVGCGGLGSPAAFYLAAAGIGRLGLVDRDVVELSNLQRQVLHQVARLGVPKTESARQTLQALNPHVAIDTYPLGLTAANVAEIVGAYEVVVDAVDNFETRYLVNDACVAAGKPLVEAGVLRWDGMLTTIIPGRGPCYRCLFPTPPPPGTVPTTAEVGLMGTIPGVMGVLQANEVLKLILGVGEPLVGRLLLFDGLRGSFQEVVIKRNPTCPVCVNKNC
ncbi:MAG: molybdopterin-synthase adenylyltransferase MoeB [Clostridia bacterium]|nr:molybdopterin-synthase adenylyltransferase MoeB [Clostridia bacterium]MBC7346824.1 molybdopterin-synthase adenylyltransferase MoeB [Clostridia bacterium]